MKTIFVMVKCELGKSYKVADAAVNNLEEVSEVHSTSGQYDLLMKCYLPDDADIGHFVVERSQVLVRSRDLAVYHRQGARVNFHDPGHSSLRWEDHAEGHERAGDADDGQGPHDPGAVA